MLKGYCLRLRECFVPIQGTSGRFLFLSALTGSLTVALLLSSSPSLGQSLPPRPDPVDVPPGLCKHTLGEIAEALADGTSLGDGTIIEYTQIGAFDQILATSDPAVGCATGFPTAGAHYLVLSTGSAGTSLSANTSASYGDCVGDPDYGYLCDSAGIDLTVALSPAAGLLNLDFRYFTWDYNPSGPFEDPFRVTIVPELSPPVTIYDTGMTCEFSTKGPGLQCGDPKKVTIDVSAWAGSTIHLKLEVSDQYDSVVDTGVVVDNLSVVPSGSSFGESLPSCAGPCDDLEFCGYGYGYGESVVASLAAGGGGSGSGCSIYGVGDGVCDQFDNCPFDMNPDQADCDNNGIGDACDSDSDFDGRSDGCDNCPFDPNYDQKDCNADGVGDFCDFVSTCNPPIVDSFNMRKEVDAIGAPYYSAQGEGLVEVEMVGHSLLDDITVTLSGTGGTFVGFLTSADPKGLKASAVFDMNGVPVGAYELQVERFGQTGSAVQNIQVWPSVPNVRTTFHPGPPSPGRNVTNEWYLGNQGTRDAVVVMGIAHPTQFLPVSLSVSSGSFFGAEDYSILHQQGRLQVIAVYVGNRSSKTVRVVNYWPSGNFASALESFCAGKPASCKGQNAWDPQYGVITGQKLPLGWPVQYDDLVIATLTVDEWDTVKSLPIADLLDQSYEYDRSRQLANVQLVPLILPTLSPEQSATLSDVEATFAQSPYSVFKTTVARRLALP